MAKTLYEHYTSKGQELPSVSERIGVATQAGITGYTGTASQNNQLLSFLEKGSGSTTVPTVQSSDMSRQAALDAQNKLTNLQNRTANTTTTTTTKKPAVVLNENKSDLQTRLDMINSSAASEIDSINSMFGNMSRTMNANSNSLISSIQNTFSRRIGQMQEVNNATQRGVETAGFVSGRARYAPELQTAIISNTEREGINRIMDLEVQEQQLIAEAQSASDGKEMQMLFQRMDSLGKVHSSKMSAIGDLNKEVIEMEKLNLQKAQEQRQQIKDDLANDQTISKNLASSLEASFTGNAEEDQAMVISAAREYGIDPNFLNQSIADARADKAKSLPSDIREYDELVGRGQYKGSFLGYQKAKAAANKIASSETKELTQADTDRYDLPIELVGKSPKEIIEDLSVTRMPAWFKMSETRAGRVPTQENWDAFRDTGDMKVFKNTIDINKVESGQLDWYRAYLAGVGGGIPAVGE